MDSSFFYPPSLFGGTEAYLIDIGRESFIADAKQERRRITGFAQDPLLSEESTNSMNRRAKYP